MTEKINNLQQVLTMEEAMGLENLYGSEKAFISAPKQMGGKGIRVNLSFDINAGTIDAENYGCQELIAKKQDLADSKVSPNNGDNFPFNVTAVKPTHFSLALMN